MDPIRVFSASDINFAQHLAVMLTSLLENTVNPIEVYILDGGIADADKDKIKNIGIKYQTNIHFLDIDVNEFKNLVTRVHLPVASYYRLNITNLIDESIDKILYLDCDMIINKDLASLWNTDIKDHYIAAVEDINIDYDEYFIFMKEGLNIPKDHKYFNSGVMLINLEKWRKDDITNKVLDFIKQYPEKIYLCDQDGLNAVLVNGWLDLPLCWNHQTAFFKFKDSGHEEIENHLYNPSITHYTGKLKPWDYMCDHPFKHEYFRYLEITDWKGFVPKDRTILNMLKKYRDQFRSYKKTLIKRMLSACFPV